MTVLGEPKNEACRGSHLSVLVVALLLGTFACSAADPDRAWTDTDQAGSAGATVAAEPPAAIRLPPAGYAWVIFGPDTVVAEVAATADERAEGLMYRDEIPEETGMLFVFRDNQLRSFWMANTYVPLDIAYMDPSYRIVNIVQMEPLVTDSYPSTGPAMFALEVRQGWFGDQGVVAGDRANIVFGVMGR